MASDRIFGLVASLLALAYIASATQIETSFLSDPVGPRSFPILIGIVGAICGVMMILKPDEEPVWPAKQVFLSLGFAVLVLIAYAYSLKPFGFIIPTALAAGILSYQISPNPKYASLAGIGLSLGLFVLFKYAFGLGLVALPKFLMG